MHGSYGICDSFLNLLQETHVAHGTIPVNLQPLSPRPSIQRWLLQNFHVNQGLTNLKLGPSQQRSNTGWTEQHFRENDESDIQVFFLDSRQRVRMQMYVYWNIEIKVITTCICIYNYAFLKIYMIYPLQAFCCILRVRESLNSKFY